MTSRDDSIQQQHAVQTLAATADESGAVSSFRAAGGSWVAGTVTHVMARVLLRAAVPSGTLITAFLSLVLDASAQLLSSLHSLNLI